MPSESNPPRENKASGPAGPRHLGRWRGSVPGKRTAVALCTLLPADNMYEGGPAFELQPNTCRSCRAIAILCDVELSTVVTPAYWRLRDLLAEIVAELATDLPR